jgi:hypothetical protein
MILFPYSLASLSVVQPAVETTFHCVIEPSFDFAVQSQSSFLGRFSSCVGAFANFVHGSGGSGAKRSSLNFQADEELNSQYKF